MQVQKQPFRTIWMHPDKPDTLCIIDQRFLPHEFKIAELRTVDDAFYAIADMQVRGAPLIGVTAAFGMVLAANTAPEKDFDAFIQKSAQKLISARPTAVNLAWAVEQQLQALAPAATLDEKRSLALANAKHMADEDIAICRQIGAHGFHLIEKIFREKKRPVQILTHCNAGWLACVDRGTATAPIYHAFEAGIPLHVWVDETRPRNQGASLTAWELGEQGVPHTLIADNTGGHLMQHGQVDLVIVGTDRTTRTGDVANKIGTYLKALAAQDNRIPFYVAAPSSSIDWNLRDGIKEIEIEKRNPDEVRIMSGLTERGISEKILICPPKTPAVNYGFDVTPARLVTGLITERGIADASEAGLIKLFPEKKPVSSDSPA
jgi:methylthioribose-1-phosphate isomerase